MHEPAESRMATLETEETRIETHFRETRAGKVRGTRVGGGAEAIPEPLLILVALPIPDLLPPWSIDSNPSAKERQGVRIDPYAT